MNYYKDKFCQNKLRHAIQERLLNTKPARTSISFLFLIALLIKSLGDKLLRHMCTSDSQCLSQNCYSSVYSKKGTGEAFSSNAQCKLK